MANTNSLVSQAYLDIVLKSHYFDSEDVNLKRKRFLSCNDRDLTGISKSVWILLLIPLLFAYLRVLK